MRRITMKPMLALTWLVVSANAQNLSLSTYSFDVAIVNSVAPSAEVSSCLDNISRTHIAWIKTVGSNKYLMYSRFDNGQVITREISTATTSEWKLGPSIIADDNNNPHIVYFVKRDISDPTNIRSGNFAVMYAGDPLGNGSFEVSQVSTNPSSPNTNVDGVFNCYVNGRPQISIDNGVVLVSYLATGISQTNYHKYIIFAHKNGTSWNRSQEIDMDKFAQLGVGDDITVPRKMTPEKYNVWIDISNYEPHFNLKSGSTWSSYTIPGFAGIFSNKHAQIDLDNQGVVHFLWFNEDTKKFLNATLTGTSYTFVSTPIAISPSGNFRPATIDPSNGKPYYCYLVSDFATSKIVFLAFDQNNLATTQEIKDIGSPYGKRSLNVRNGFVSLVTASQTNSKIYITTGLVSGSQGTLVVPTPISPTDGAVGVSTNSTLSWSASTGATSYRLQVSTITSTIIDQSGITGTSYNLTGLSSATTYYWRVSASNSGVSSAFSSTRSFTTQGTSATTTVPLRYFDPTSTQKTYTIDRVYPIDTGFFFGTNYYGDQAKATALVLPAGALQGKVTQVKVWFGYKRSGLTNQTYRIQFFNGSGPSGPTGPSLYSQQFNMADVLADANLGTARLPTIHSLTQQVTVGQKFFVAVDFGAYGSSDYGDVAIVTSPFVSFRVEEQWEKWNDGTWHNVSDDWYGDPAASAFMWIEASVLVGTATSAENRTSGVPSEYRLDQNYPNPFNPSTTIHYALARTSSVSLKIYNTLGQLVTTLVDEPKDAGAYQVQWNANVPSGIYFYRLQAGEFAEMKKMVLLR